MYSNKLRMMYLNIAFVNSKRFKSTENVNRMIANYFGFTERYVAHLSVKHGFHNLEYVELKELLNVFSKLQFDEKEVYKHPKMLFMTPRKVESHYAVLKEVGFANVGATEVAKTYFRINIKMLKLLKHISEHVHVPKTLLSYLHPKPTNFDVNKFTDRDILSEIHFTIVRHYLMWRLMWTEYEIDAFFKENGIVKFKSLRNMCENIDLAESLGFTPTKLLKFGYLLTNIPDYPKTVLQTMPNLAGTDMKLEMYKNPKLISVPPWNFSKIYIILKDASIDDAMIREYMNVFTLTPETIQLRLKEIKTTPEFNVLINNPNVLKLIMHHNRAQSRLSFQHQLQLKCVGMTLLSTSNHSYQENLREGMDINKRADVFNLLKHLLDCDYDSVKISIRRHPYYLQIPLVNIEKSVKYLLTCFCKESIVKVLPIVLYGIDKIEDALSKISKDEHLQNTKLTDEKRLNLVLYYIEKEHHFTGNGVWSHQVVN